MLSIDEAISHAREVSSRKFDDRVHCIRCSEFHEQLTEWLEELKAYREIGTVEECKNSVLDIQKAYNKAIDDALSVVEWDGYTIDIKERIEQLKKI